MMTLKEFVEKVNFFEHFRVYQPNRDCLIYESYFKVHSPYFWDKKRYLDFNKDYYEDNDYCDNAYNKVIDKETKEFLKRFGNYEVFSLECGSFRPLRVQLTDTGGLVQEVKDQNRLDREWLPCFDVFIVPRKE